MSDLAERVRALRPSGPARDLGTPGTAVWAAVWAAAVGVLGLLAVVLLGWLADGRSGGAGGAMQVGLQAFALAHGGTLTADWGDIGLVPLGLTLGVAWLTMRAGAALADRRDLRTPSALAAGLAVFVASYAVCVGLVALLAGSDTVAVSVPRAAVGAVVIAALSSVAGALRVSGTGLLPLGRIHGPRRAAGAAVLAGLLALLVTGTGVFATALALDIGGYGEVSRAVAPGAVGVLGLGLLGLLLLPNAVVFAATAGIGPGFSIGRGTEVGAFGVHLDTVPALPLLAALPDAGTPPYLALIVPLLTGAAIGWVLVSRLDAEDERGVLSAAAWAAGCAVACAALLGLTSYAAGGPLGDGRLATVGPSGWVVATYAAVELAAVAAGTAAVLRHRATRA